MSTKPIAIVVAALLFAITITTKAEHQKYVIQFDQKNFADTIPIHFVGNRILMGVEIGGKPYTFLFDTGCSNSMVFDSTLVTLSDAKAEYIRDATGRRKKYRYYTIPQLRIGHLTANNVICTVNGDNNIMGKAMLCAGVSGIIGADMMASRLLMIDTHAGYMVLTDRPQHLDTNGYRSAKMMVKTSNPHVGVNLSQQVDLPNVFYDSGSQNFFKLSHQDRNRILKKHKGQDPFQSMLHTKTQGVISAGISGLADADSIRLYVIDVMQVAGITFRNVKMANSTEPTELGAEMLKCCAAIFDNQKSRIYLKPLTPHGDDTYSVYEHTISFHPKIQMYPTLFPVGDEWRVAVVWPESPVKNMNPEIGDKLILFNGKPARECECEIYKRFFFSETGHQLTLQKKDGTTYSYME